MECVFEIKYTIPNKNDEFTDIPYTFPEMGKAYTFLMKHSNQQSKIEDILICKVDEFDDEDVTFSKLDDNNYIFDGKTSLKDFYKILKIEDSAIFENHKGDAETIAGFVLEILGSFPKQGTKINFKNYVFIIEALDKKRIKLVKLTILNE